MHPFQILIHSINSSQVAATRGSFRPAATISLTPHSYRTSNRSVNLGNCRRSLNDAGARPFIAGSVCATAGDSQNQYQAHGC